jgi:hypothetical protein
MKQIFCPSHIKSAVSLAISAQLIFSPYLALASDRVNPNSIRTSSFAGTPTSSAGKSVNSANAQLANAAASAELEANPFLKQLMESQVSADGFQIPFSINDPALDKDAFLLGSGSQTWLTRSSFNSGSANQLTNDSSESLVRKNSDGTLDITVPRSNRTLHINAPLSALQATDNYFFLTLDPSSDWFQKAAGPGVAPGEGLFIIQRAGLASAANANIPVPVYFLPLPGSGWTGKVVSQYLPQLDTLALASRGGDLIPLELKDVATLIEAENMNLQLALEATAKFDPSGMGQDLREHKVIRPAPGTTAGFGMFFTGLNLKSPQNSYWKTVEQLAALENSKFNSSKWLNALLNKLPMGLGILLPQQAQAITLSPKVIGILQYVGTIVAAMMVISVVVKYSHPGVRAKMKAIRENDIKSGARKEPKTLLGKAGREVREVFDVFAPVATTVAQIPAVTTGDAIEMFLDRFFTASTSGDHTLVRRALNKSFYFSRRSLSNVPTDSKTFALGALYMGAIDTAAVGIQLDTVVPWMSKELLLPHVSPELGAKIVDAFDYNNPNYKNTVIGEILANGQSHFVRGAAGFSIEARQLATAAIQVETDNELRNQGINPLLPENESKRDHLFEEKMNKRLQLSGLPGSDKFLFDLNTIYAQGPKWFGYRTPEEMQTEETFIYQKRHQMRRSVMKRAIEHANRIAIESPSTQATQTLQLLQQELRDMSYVGSTSEERMAARQRQYLLSYQGPISWAVKHVPEIWKSKYSPEVAQAAAIYTRLSLFSFLNEDGMKLLTPTRADVEAYAKRAHEITVGQIIKDHPELQKLSAADAEREIRTKYFYEQRVRTQLVIIQLAKERREDAKISAYTPPKMDWMERRKRGRAELIADEATAIYVSSVSEQIGNATSNDERARLQSSLTDESLRKIWRKHYRDALVREVGLNLDRPDTDAKANKRYKDLLELIEFEAVTQTSLQFENNREMKEYSAKLNEIEKFKYETRIYVHNFLARYKLATVDLELLPATDSQMPGAFQKWRQNEWVIKHPKVTRLIRSIESLYNDEAITEMGFLKGSVARSVPLVDDLINSHIRIAKLSVGIMTTGYAWSRLFWQVTTPYPIYGMLLAAAAATINTPYQILTRLCRLNGLKPMDNIFAKTVYALPYPWLTFFGAFTLIWAGDVNSFFNEQLLDPVKDLAAKFTPERWLEAGIAAGLFVVGGKAATKAIEKNQMRKDNDPNSNAVRVRRCESIFTINIAPPRVM